jgi:CHAD domain-containing protein
MSAETHAETRAGLYVARLLVYLADATERAANRVADDNDPDAVHDFRVAMRKTRTLLKAARGLFGRSLVDAVRDGFTDVHRATNDLRDEEVFLQTLEELGLHGDEFERFLLARRARKEELHRGVVALVRGPKLKRAFEALRALAQTRAPRARDRNALALARKIETRAQDDVEDQRSADPYDATALHQLRIAWKNLRYVCELLGEALPPAARNLAEPASELQKRLGNLHDIDAALAAVDDATLKPKAFAREVTGALEKTRKKRLKKFLRADRAAKQARRKARRAVARDHSNTFEQEATTPF